MSSHQPVTALGIDIGSTNTKAALIEVNGTTVVELAVRARTTPESGRELLDSVAELARAVVDDAPRPPQAVGVAAMAETGVAWDDSGPIGPLLRWDAEDAELTDASTELSAKLGPSKLYAATGVPVPAKTPLARWYASRRAGDTGRIRWAGAADIVAWALAGRLATDHTLAQRTMAYRLPVAGQALDVTFNPALLAHVGMTIDDVPRVVPPGRAVGAVRPDAAERFGLPAALPVFIAGHDHAVGAWAAGVRAPGDAADSIGTAEALVRLAEPGTIDRESARLEGLSLGRELTGTAETVLAGNPAAGALIAQLSAGVTPELTADAAPSWPLLLPYPHGRQSPAPDPGARLRAIGRDGGDTELPHDAEELLQAVTQGLALQLRWMAEASARLARRDGGRTVVLGGPGARSAHALALRRALLPGAVAQVSVHEPVASGAALFAATRAHLADPGATLPTRDLPGSGPDHAFDDVFARFLHAALTH